METEPSAARASSPAVPALVLDTNAVLDWLVFRDARMALLAAALESGAVRWLACPGMRDELQRVLSYGSLATWNPDSERVLAIFDRRHQPCSQPTPTGPAWRCSDADDQVFIDLALAHGARWLVTHDRALLHLRRRARAAGLLVLRPCDWPGPAAVST